MRRFDKIRNITKANILAETIYTNKKLMIEAVGFGEIKEYLLQLASEKNLQIYNKPSDFDGLRQMINSAKGVLPKDGVIAVDDFNDVNYIFVLSKDPNKAQDINNTINASKIFTTVNTRTDDIMGVSLSLLKPNKVVQPQSNNEDIETHSERPNFGQIPVDKHPAVNVDFNTLTSGQKVVIGTEGDEMSERAKVINVTPDMIVVKDSYGHTINFTKDGICTENPNIKILTLAKS